MEKAFLGDICRNSEILWKRLTATGAQFAVQQLGRHTILTAGAVGTTLSMAALVTALIYRSSPPMLLRRVQDCQRH